MSAASSVAGGGGAIVSQPNVFQRLMLQWERLAPYNAGQYATLNADFSDDHAQAAWRDVVETLGLQQIGQCLDIAPRVTHECIEAVTTAELNRPFAPDESPLRPFIHRGDCGEGWQTSIGVFYRHAVADSASIRLLTRAWIERLLLLSDSVGRRHVKLLRVDGFRPIDVRRPWSVIREGIADLSRLSRLKRVRRLCGTADATSPVEWRRIALPDGFASRLVRFARREHVRVNDLFVASAALACDALMPHEDSDLRRDLGIGTIADVRPADRPPDQHFGLMLGFLQTFWRWQDLRTFNRTLAVAAVQSRIARERHLAEASVMRMLVAQRVGEHQDSEGLANFYRKRCPLAAGISNVNLNRGWPASLHPTPVAAYTRISPLGPMLPLVFTPTTLGNTMHLGVTHRVSVLSRELVEAIVRTFIERLDHEMQLCGI